MHFFVVSLVLVGLQGCNMMPQILGDVHASVYIFKRFLKLFTEGASTTLAGSVLAC